MDLIGPQAGKGAPAAPLSLPHGLLQNPIAKGVRNNLRDSTASTASKDSPAPSIPKKLEKLFPELDTNLNSLVLVYNCALEKEILWQGKLYCTTHHLCFHSVVFGNTERIFLSWRNVISIEKKMTAAVFPNAIKITSLDGKYTFASFLKRDSAFADLTAHWKSVRGNPKVVLGAGAIAANNASAEIGGRGAGRPKSAGLSKLMNATVRRSDGKLSLLAGSRKEGGGSDGESVVSLNMATTPTTDGEGLNGVNYASSDDGDCDDEEDAEAHGQSSEADASSHNSNSSGPTSFSNSIGKSLGSLLLRSDDELPRRQTAGLNVPNQIFNVELFGKRARSVTAPHDESHLKEGASPKPVRQRAATSAIGSSSNATATPNSSSTPVPSKDSLSSRNRNSSFPAASSAGFNNTNGALTTSPTFADIPLLPTSSNTAPGTSTETSSSLPQSVISIKKSPLQNTYTSKCIITKKRFPQHHKLQHHHQHRYSASSATSSSTAATNNGAGDSFDNLQLMPSLASSVVAPRGMSLLYDPRSVMIAPLQNVKGVPLSGTVGATSIGASVVSDSVESSGEQSSQRNGGVQRSGGYSGSSNSGAGGMAGIPSKSNGGGGGGGEDDDGKDGNKKSALVSAPAATPRKPAKCTCESHEGHLLVNQVLPHGLRAFVETMMKEEGSRLLGDAYNSCGSDGHVFWPWKCGLDGKWESRVVEYTARFAGFMNAEPLLCKETQRFLTFNDDCVVLEKSVESTQKFDTGTATRALSFTNRICLTYEDTRTVRMKVHCHINNNQGTDLEKVMERSIMVRNHNFCNAIINSIKSTSMKAASTSTSISDIMLQQAYTGNTPSPDPELPGKRSSSLQPEPPENGNTTSSGKKSLPSGRESGAASPGSFLMTTEFWKSVVDTVIVGPSLSAGKALGVLIPVETTPTVPAAAPTGATAEANSAPSQTTHESHTLQPGVTKKKKKRVDGGGGVVGKSMSLPNAPTSHKTASDATPHQTPVPSREESKNIFTKGLSVFRVASAGTNAKILGVAMMAVLFGLALTVLNIMWMAELSDRLERTLDAVRVARERNAASSAASKGSGASEKPLASALPVATPVVETLSEMRARLFEHAGHLLSALPVTIERSLESVEEMKSKLHDLRMDLLKNPIVVTGSVKSVVADDD